VSLNCSVKWAITVSSSEERIPSFKKLSNFEFKIATNSFGRFIYPDWAMLDKSSYSDSLIFSLTSATF